VLQLRAHGSVDRLLSQSERRGLIEVGTVVPVRPATIADGPCAASRVAATAGKNPPGSQRLAEVPPRAYT
jgi:hypothetical protein